MKLTYDTLRDTEGVAHFNPETPHEPVRLMTVDLKTSVEVPVVLLVGVVAEYVRQRKIDKIKDADLSELVRVDDALLADLAEVLDCV